MWILLPFPHEWAKNMRATDMKPCLMVKAEETKVNLLGKIFGNKEKKVSKDVS